MKFLVDNKEAISLLSQSGRLQLAPVNLALQWQSHRRLFPGVAGLFAYGLFQCRS